MLAWIDHGVEGYSKLGIRQRREANISDTFGVGLTRKTRIQANPIVAFPSLDGSVEGLRNA
jgi:hypothetical protein